jgi:miniconductance mechanosensitive channel
MLEYINEWVIEMGVSDRFSLYISDAIILVIAIVCCFFSAVVARRVILKAVPFYVKQSKNKWDDLLLQNRVFERLHHLAPALVLYGFAQSLSGFQVWIKRLSISYMVIVSILVFSSLLDSVEGIYRTREISKSKPIKGYLQTLKIILFIIGFVIAVGIMIDRSPWILLSGVGAMAAALIIIFKDSLLGLVASIQITANNMVCLGDWIEVPRYQANGVVVDITLHIVKIQNWDNTVTTIPTYALISESFKNWRGMLETRTRLIKRSINIDITSIEFCNNDLIKELFKLPYLQKIMDEEEGLEKLETMTNIYLFRRYIEEFLKGREEIEQKNTLLVRNLALTDTGLPIEVYAFSKFESWEAFEAAQNEIFDHILAVAPAFRLRIYQRPSGYDIRER